MKSTREQFEEIWPAPEEIFWSEGKGEYWPVSNGPYDAHIAEQWDARLDTFTRCQETTAIYSGIVDDMIRDMELINSVSTDLRAVGIAREAIGRDKQKMGMMK